MMDNSANGKRPVKPAPFSNFPPRVASRPDPSFILRQPGTVSDGLQPGTLPVRPFQFSPYMPGMVNASNPGRSISFRNPPASNVGTPPNFSGPVTSNSADTGMSTLHKSESTHDHFMRINSQESVGKLKIEPNAEPYDFVASDLEDHGEIGRGAFGAVNRMVHAESNTEMAVKRIRSTVDEREQKQLLMDLEVVMRSSDCPFIVKFYGALFWEGDCWICMELMSTSLDKFYRFVYHRKNDRIPEDILGKIAVATVKALDYLKEQLQIMHRDVKPSNILIDKKGNIKLCDFGISGQLVNSIAKTRDAGCRPYMAPERIDTSRSKNGYDVRSDVWSLGITLIELSTGKFPYPKWKNVFDQLTQVVKGPPPKLRNISSGFQFSDHYMEFVNMLTIAEAEQRPKYAKLLATSYLVDMANCFVDVATYFSTVLNSMTEADFLSESNSDEPFRG